jgi:hypothetical protein
MQFADLFANIGFDTTENEHFKVGYTGRTPFICTTWIPYSSQTSVERDEVYQGPPQDLPGAGRGEGGGR